MNTQSRWIICGYHSKSDNWLNIGNMKPQLTPSKFYEVIEPHRKNYTHFGIWVVGHKWIPSSGLAPKNEVRSIDEIFRDTTQIKDADDVLDGMTFISKLEKTEIVVLAQREGYVMKKPIDNSSAPSLIHWKELIQKYELATLINN